MRRWTTYTGYRVTYWGPAGGLWATSRHSSCSGSHLCGEPHSVLVSSLTHQLPQTVSQKSKRGERNQTLWCGLIYILWFKNLHLWLCHSLKTLSLNRTPPPPPPLPSSHPFLPARGDLCQQSGVMTTQSWDFMMQYGCKKKKEKSAGEQKLSLQGELHVGDMSAYD